MADRYFIGAVDNTWNDTGNWSTSSGGSGGASIPGVSDNVYFDQTNDCTFDVDVSVNALYIQNASATISTDGYNLTLAGFFAQTAGTFDSNSGTGGTSTITYNSLLSIGNSVDVTYIQGNAQATCKGNVSIGENATFTSGSGKLILDSVNGAYSISDASGTNLGNIDVNRSGGSDPYNIGSDILCNYFTIVSGEFQFNNSFTYNLSVVYTFTMGASTTLTFQGGNGSITARTIDNSSDSTITHTNETWIIDNGSNATTIDFGDGEVIFDLELASDSTGDVTFNESFRVDGTFTLNPGNSCKFNNTDTFTFDAISWVGVDGNPITLRSDSDGDQWSLDVGDGVGSTNVYYVDVKDSDASSGDDITDINGTNSLNNTNWTFITSSSSSSSNSSSSFSSCSSSSSFSSSCSSSSSFSSSCSSSSSASPDPNDRYFVGDTDSDWNTSDNWSTYSGGPGGAGVPTTSNDVYFDDNSPACTLSSNGVCNTLNDTAGASNSLDLNDNNLTVESDITLSEAGFTLIMGSGTLTGNNTSAGSALDISCTVTPETGTLYAKRSALLSVSGTFYDIKIADSGYTCEVFTNTNFSNSFVLNGGTFNNTNIVNLTFVGSGSKGTIIDFVTGSDITNSSLDVVIQNSAAGSGTILGFVSGLSNHVRMSNSASGTGTFTLTQSENVTLDSLTCGPSGSTIAWVTDGYDFTTTHDTQYSELGSNGSFNSSSGTGGTSTITWGSTYKFLLSGGSVTQGNAAWIFDGKTSEGFRITGGTFTGGTGTITCKGDVDFDGGSFVQGAQTINFIGADSAFTIAGAYFTKNASGLIVFGPVSGIQVFDLPDGFIVSIGNIEIDAGSSTVYGYSSATNYRCDNLTLTSGTFSNRNAPLYVSGAAVLNGGTFFMEEFVAFEDTLNLSGAAFSLSGADLRLSGASTLSSGTFTTANGGTITIRNDFTVTGASISDSVVTWLFDTATTCDIDFNGETIYKLSLGDDSTPDMNITGDVVISDTFYIRPFATVTFTSGITVEADVLDWIGASSDIIVLRASGATHWNLIVTNSPGGGGDMAVSYVDVQLSDAFGGVTIDATDGTSTNSGSNLNWDFGPGASSSSSSSSSSSFSSCSSSSSSSSFSSCSSSSESTSSFSSSSSSDTLERYWVNDDTDNDWDNANNWATTSGGSGGAGVPTASDSVYFDTNSGAENCTLSTSAVCLSLTADANYSGAFDQNGQTLDVSGSFSYDGTGVLTLDAALTLDADGDFHIGTGTDAASDLTACDLDLQGTGNLDIDDAGLRFASITCSASGKTTTNTGSNNLGVSVDLTVGSGTLTITTDLIVRTISTTTVTIDPSATINGGKRLILSYFGSGGDTISVPACTFSGTSTNGLYLRQWFGSGGPTYSLAGNITAPDIRISAYSHKVTVNTNNYNLTASSEIDIYNEGAGGELEVNFGSSTVDTVVATLGASTGTALDINLQTSTWTVEGDLTIGSITTLTSGSSSVTFDGTTNQDITMFGQSLYTALVNNTGGGITLQDAFSANTLEVDSGDFDQNGQIITTVSDITIDGTDIITLDGSITMTGDGDFHIGNTISSLAVTGCNLDLQGTGNLDIDKATNNSNKFNNVTCGYAGKTTTVTGTASLYIGGVCTIASATGELNMAGNATTLILTGTGTPFVSNNGLLSHTGYKTINFYTTSAGSVNIDVPNTTTGVIIYVGSAIAGTVTYTLVDDIGEGTAPIWYLTINNQINNASCVTEFNTGNYNITTGYSINDYAGQALSTKTSNYGSSTITTSRYIQLNNGTANINFQTSIWNISTAFTMVNTGTTTVDPGTSQITFTGSAPTLTSAGNTLYDVIFNHTGTAVIADTAHFNRWLIEPGKAIDVTAGETVQIDAYTAGDIDGTSGNLVTLNSTTPGSEWFYDNPAGMTVSYVAVQDSTATNEVDASDGTNVDGTGNTNWDFVGSSSSSSSSSSISSISSSSSSSSSESVGSCSSSSSNSSSSSSSSESTSSCSSSSSFSSSSCSSSSSNSSSSSSSSESVSSSSSSSSESNSSCSSSSTSTSPSSSSSSSQSPTGALYYVSDGTYPTWNDPLNWSVVSGGSGGAGVPTISDDVIFDSNSTRDCPIHSDANCNSITFSSYSQTLNINGRTLTVEDASSIVGGSVNISSGTIVIKESSTIRPTTVTTGGTWRFPLTSSITIKADRDTNLGVVSITGGSSYTFNVDEDVSNGGLKATTLSSTANITSTANAYLDATNWDLDNCTLTAGSNVYFRGGATFDTVSVGITGTFIIAANGSYDFDNSVFPNIQSLTGGELSISFTSAFSTFGLMTLREGDTVSFSNSGTFNFNVISWDGASGNLLTLQTLGSGSWNLDIDESSPSVTYVDVSNSNASFGSAVDASDGTSVDGGSNTNWIFPSSSSSSSSSSESSSSESSGLSCSSSSSSESSSSSFSSCSSSSMSESSCSSSSCSSSESPSSSSSCSSSLSSSSSSFSSCSSSSVSGSSFTALERTVTEAAVEEGVVFIPDSKIEDFLHDPFKGVPRFVFNRGYALSQDDMTAYEELTRNAIGNHFTGLMKYPGIVDRR